MLSLFPSVVVFSSKEQDQQPAGQENEEGNMVATGVHYPALGGTISSSKRPAWSGTGAERKREKRADREEKEED